MDFSSKAQGTTEYLVIVGVVITMALIVTTVVINSIGTVDTTSVSSQSTSLQSDILGAGEVMVNPQGLASITLKNNDVDPVTITQIFFNDSNAVFSKMLFPNESQTFSVQTVPNCDSGRTVFNITIIYQSKEKLEKNKVLSNIITPCQAYTVINPLRVNKYLYFVGDFSCPFDLNCTSLSTYLYSTDNSGVSKRIEGNYTYYSFSASGTYSVITDFNGDINAYLWGAGGAGGGYASSSRTGGSGGGGGFASSIISVNRDDNLTISVGEGGKGGIHCVAASGGGTGGTSAYGAGGRGGNTGPSGCSSGGGGGGAGSFIFRDTTLLVAAGGGGGGGGTEGSGNGGAGGASGVNGSAGASGSSGGTAGATSTYNGNNGTDKASGDGSAGGGGGGGYRGGNGGTSPYSDGYGAGGGGGGTSYGTTTANGSGTTPGNSTDTLRGIYAGIGGVGGNNAVDGNPGIVVIKYLTSLGNLKIIGKKNSIIFTGELDWNKNASTINSPGLVGYYKFNDLFSGAKVIDYAGYDNNLVSIYGAKVQSNGLFGTKSAYFVGSGYFRTEATSAFDFERTSTYSACAWIYPTNNTSNMTILSKMASGGSKGWDLYITGGKTLKAHVINSWSSNAIDVYTTDPIIEQYKWQHVCVTYDGSSSVSGLKLYYNGSLAPVTIDMQSLTSSITNSYYFSVGSRSGADIFLGYIDEVKIWNRTLSAQNVSDDYNYWMSNAEYISEIIDLNDPPAFIHSINLNTIGPIYSREINPTLDSELSNGLAALWHFDESDGNHSDSSTNGLTAQEPVVEEPSSEEAFTAHVFKASGTFTPAQDMNVELLVIGGGGAGGNDAGGGGGAGGLIYESSYPVTDQTYTVTIGAGGTGGQQHTTTYPGANSVFGDLTAIGGGRGAYYSSSSGTSGGSGGGGPSCCFSASAGSGTSGQGHDGSSTSGGGGAGAAGNGCVGGEGLYFSQFALLGGSPAGWFAGGGSGGCSDLTVNGGGGRGGNWASSLDPSCHGIANTGGGGGGGAGGADGAYGCSGGSGIVIVKYLNTQGTATSTNSTVIDSSNNTVTYSPSATEGLWDTNALTFNGSTTYLKVNNNSALNNQSSFTISQWVYFEDYSSSMTIVSKDGASGFILRIGGGSINNGQLYARYGTAAGTIGPAGMVSSNAWHHIAVTFASGTLTAYYDGEKVGTLSGSAPSGMNDSLFIGAAASDGATTPNSYYFNGKIEELAMWNRALSNDEIKDVYSIGSSGLGIEYRACSDANCQGESWSSPSYDQNTVVPIGKESKYLQWLLKPTYYQFHESKSAGCYAGSATTNYCTGFSSQDSCEAENAWNGDCSWGEGAYYCKDNPNYGGYPYCWYFDGSEYECNLRSPTCSYYSYTYCDGDSYGYCNYNFYDESSCNSQSSCYWDGYSYCNGDMYGYCNYNYYDESSCNSQNGCYWDGSGCYPSTDCSYNYDSGSCSSYSGCYWYSSGSCYPTRNCYDQYDQSSCESTSGCYWYGYSYCSTNSNCSSMSTQEESLCNSTEGCYWGTDATCESSSGATIPCSMAQSSTTCNYLSGCLFRINSIDQYTTRPNAMPKIIDLNIFYYN